VHAGKFEQSWPGNICHDTAVGIAYVYIFAMRLQPDHSRCKYCENNGYITQNESPFHIIDKSKVLLKFHGIDRVDDLAGSRPLVGNAIFAISTVLGTTGGFLPKGGLINGFVAAFNEP